MARPLTAWKPTADEVKRIVIEMRPIIEEFARRAREDRAETMSAASH
jgi:hypothetical protein